MIDWYTSLPIAQQVFAGLALGFGAILTLLMFGSLAGADTDADVDTEFDSGGISIKGVLAFISFFGLGGWIMLRAGSPTWLAVVVGSGTGYAMMSLMALMLARLRRLDTDGGRRAENLLHQVGEVYLTVPASGQGVGRIQVRQGSRLVEVEAVTKGALIATGNRARVVEVLSPGRVLVEAIVRVGERSRPGGFVQ